MSGQGAGLSGTISRISIVSILSIFPKSRPRVRAGLTLVEVLFVMIVFAILIGLVIGLGRYADTATRIHQARADLGEWTAALSRWHDTFGDYPTSAADGTVGGLVSNTVSITRLTAAAQATAYAAVGSLTNTLAMTAFFRDLPLQDPWRQPYRYTATNALSGVVLSYHLYSAGPDPTSGGTHDDITFSN
jgi:prepilin-type N-terminal cleavage/methylation domain-containing protein